MRKGRCGEPPAPLPTAAGSCRRGPSTPRAASRTNRFFAGAVLLTVPLFLGPGAPSLKKQSEIVDAGAFTLIQAGERIGEERFVIRAEQAGSDRIIYRARAELALKYQGVASHVAVALEVVAVDGGDHVPRRYEAEVNGGAPTRIVATLARDRVRLDVRSPQGERMSELLVRGKAAILDKRIAHQHFFLWKLLGEARSSDAVVVIPQDGTRQSGSIEDLGRGRVRVADREYEARHIVLRARSGSTHHVWLDGDKVLRVDVPEEGYTAYRTDTSN